jgi:hypothetical protein
LWRVKNVALLSPLTAFAMLRQQIDKRLVQVDDQAGAIGTRELQP